LPDEGRAVCCDLLTALVDSWALWRRAAGDQALGDRWRLKSLELVTAAGRYRPYEAIVVEAAQAVGVDDASVDRLFGGWGELEPYPDVAGALGALRLPVVVVTNTSQRLAELAAGKLGIELAAVVSAEASGWYKPEPNAYQAGATAAGLKRTEDCLFVAGSPHDVVGAARAGHPVFWANRRRLPVPVGGEARWDQPTLQGLPAAIAEWVSRTGNS